MAGVNRQWLLAARPVGFPKESDFQFAESPVPEPGADEFLVRTHFISVDPYMRGRMNEARAYADPFEIGKPIYGGSTGEVIASNHPGYKAGEFVSGMWGWQEYGVSDGTGCFKVDPALAPISTSLGVLGMPGMTAYFGFLEICQPKSGETVFVSGAAGAVGSLVGQIAKIKGCYVAGSAGSDDKVQYLLEEDGFDAAFNYKEVKDYPAKIREVCPKGVDCYFDNVGGAITDAVLLNLNNFARISICGQISMYNATKPQMGPRLYSMLLIRQARMEGFLVFRFLDRYPEGMKQMAQWIKEGKIRYREDVLDGIENVPKAFIRMLNGENRGKQLVRTV